jgi:dTDP-4-amino-4,6-dideoxygalactose transaminase
MTDTSAPTVPFSPVDISDGEVAEAVASLQSGWLTTGPRVGEFERRLSTATGAPAALAVNSGTAAMHLALLALGIGEGDAVITTPLTFCSTVHVIEHVGATPVLVDIEPDTLNIDPARVEQAIAGRAPGEPPVRAILPVHFGGHPVDLAAITALADQHDLAVVEDAAHAIGAACGEIPIGATGGHPRRAVAFSFYATKNLATGEGGALCGAPEVVAEARPWSLHGMSRDAWRRYETLGAWHYDVDRAGFKYNLTEVAAAVGLVQLDRLPAMQARRARHAARYVEAFGDLDALELPVTRPGVTNAHHLFPVRLRLERLSIDRAQFIHELATRGVATSVHFIPVHHHAYYRQRYGWGPGDHAVCDAAFPRLVSLPCSSGHTDAQIDRVIEVVGEVCATFAT